MYNNFTYVIVRAFKGKVEGFYYGSASSMNRYKGAPEFGRLKSTFKHHNYLVNASIKQYGYCNHYFLLIKEYSTREGAYAAEQRLINESIGFPDCWNISPFTINVNYKKTRKR